MTGFAPIFAAAEIPVELMGGNRGTNALPWWHLSDLMLILIASVLLMTLLICWAVFIRKPGTDGTRARIYKSRPTETETEDGMIRKRKRHKKKRRDHRTRNPTLSETGGLPPPRPEGPPNPHI